MGSAPSHASYDPFFIDADDSMAFPADWFDAAFSIFAAHELRDHDQRVRLFVEIARILTPDGEFILNEHSRDWHNFLAFGPGFLHFFSESAWRKAASDAGLTVLTELSMTPLCTSMSCGGRYDSLHSYCKLSNSAHVARPELHFLQSLLSEVIQVAIDAHEAPTSAAKSSSTTRLLASRFSGDSALP